MTKEEKFTGMKVEGKKLKPVPETIFYKGKKKNETVPVTSLPEGASFKFKSGKLTYKIMTILKKGKNIVGLELEDSLNRLYKASCKQTLESQVFPV